VLLRGCLVDRGQLQEAQFEFVLRFIT